MTKKAFASKTEPIEIQVRSVTHRGTLSIAEVEIDCANLDNGARVITQTGLFHAFDRPRKGELRQEGLPSIIGAKNLLPYVTEEIREKSIPIPYVHMNGSIAYGYNAELIPLLCIMYEDAGRDGALASSQDKVAVQARILYRSLAKIGIVALIDEATGAQDERERNELSFLLRKYISEDFLKWQTRFPKKFYQELFRLFNWEYNPQSLRRPQYVGKFTNQYVYKQLPEGVLEEMRKKTPKNEKGFRKKKFWQSLTPDIGITHLELHLTKLITIMELSSDIKDFNEKFNKLFAPKVPIQNGLFDLDNEDIDNGVE